MTRLLAILFLTSCLTSTVVAADVDLSQSKITPEAEKVPGGMMVTVNVVLKNTGDKPSDGTDLTISFPQNGFFMRIDELPELKRDDNEREVTARVNIPAGEEYRFAFVVLAPRSEVGKTLSMHIEVRNLLADSLTAARWNSDVSIKITSVPTTDGVVIGGLRFHPAAGSFAMGAGTSQVQCAAAANRCSSNASVWDRLTGDVSAGVRDGGWRDGLARSANADELEGSSSDHSGPPGSRENLVGQQIRQAEANKLDAHTRIRVEVSGG